jgi:hypothetical protein
MPKTHASRSRRMGADLSAAERLQEVAQLLAAGVLRLHARFAVPGAEPPRQQSCEFAPDPLEVPLETVLSVTRVNGFESPNRRRL